MVSEIATALPPEIERAKQLIKSNLRWHTRFVHGYSMPEHQLVWVEALEDMSIKRLLIVAPPKSGKTPVVGGDYLGWRIGNDPNGYHCLYISNTATQANKQSVALRDTIASNENYRFLYDLQPDAMKGWGENEWYIKRKNEADKDPTLQATGVGGPILGATVQEIVLDDVADEENQSSEYQRQKLMEWLRLTAFSRLVPGGRVISICTRWSESDPAAIFEQEGWVVIHIPAINENGESTYPQFWSIDSLIGDHAGSVLGISPEGGTGIEYRGRKALSDAVRRFELVYQGHVMQAGGNTFRHEWWRYWTQALAPWRLDPHSSGYMAIHGIVQCWDTAVKEKQANDYSVCTTWAILDNGYYLLDMWRGKVDFPKLKRTADDLWEQWKPMVVLVEDASSGQQLIQEFRSNTRIPVVGVPASNKVLRANTVSSTVEAGKVFLPEEAPWRLIFEHELEVFPSGVNDDICFAAGTLIATLWGDKPIENVRQGDMVLSPSGVSKVLWAGKTGISMTIEKMGLKGTPSHTVFTYDGWAKMDTLTNFMRFDILSLGGLIKWIYRKQLFLKELHLVSWGGREDIILASRILTKEDGVLKDFMLRFGKMLMDGQFPRAMLFIMRTSIHIITTLVIWSVYRVSNTIRQCICQTRENKKGILLILGRWLQNGINLLKGMNGIGAMRLKVSNKAKSIFIPVNGAGNRLIRRRNHPVSAQMIAGGDTESQRDFMAVSSVQCAESGSIPANPSIIKEIPKLVAFPVQENYTIVTDVYNLTVQGDQVYYANGLLVSNCDSVTHFLTWIRDHVTTGPSIPTGLEKKSTWRQD